MAETMHLLQFDILNRPSVADQVFAELHRQVLSLELPPGARISEVDIAKALGVSRQPVRDAFYRMSKMGFLVIRPQRTAMKQREAMIAAVRRNDTVVTGGGIVGKVTKVLDEEKEVEVEIAPNVKVRVLRSTIADVRVKGEPVK